MATGLEILGGVAASLELIKVAKSCLSTFSELHHADIQERDQTDMQFLFIVQGLKFNSWCSSLGIQSMFELSEISPSQWQQKTKVKQFEDLLQSQLRFGSQNPAALVLKILKSMEQKFSEAEKLMVKYATSKPVQAPSSKSSKLYLMWPRLWKTKEEVSLSSRDISRECYVIRLGQYYMT